MAVEATVFKAGWTLDDIQWSKFDASKVDPELLATVKGAALVEYNAPDYVAYLKRVFKNSGARALADIEQWGVEETQHGRALGRWAEMADPAFRLDESLARFRKGYRAPHFASTAETSVRGSRRGEMIARCVVESGTSSYYSALRESTDEPVLKEIAGRIAADEFRHYKLFFETLNVQDEPDISFWKKLMVAIGRVNESDDDELAYAYYCANVPVDREASVPYRRQACVKAYQAKTVSLYRRHHVRKLVQMVAKAIGANPQSRMTEWAGALAWHAMRLRAAHSRAAASKVPA